MSRTASIAVAVGILAATAAGVAGYYLGASHERAPNGIRSAASAAASVIEDSRISTAKAEIIKGLFDPDSVQWRNVRIVGDFVVCGELNAKNRMGGYVGFTPFYASVYPDGLVLPRVVLDPDGTVDDTERRARVLTQDDWREACRIGR